MKQAELFPQPPTPHPAAMLAERLWALASQGIYFGSSSWKYESWWTPGCGPIYAGHYKSKKDFDQNCLAEYAQTFPAVGGDFSFYNWPSQDMVSRIDLQTPVGFKIGLKATEISTLKRFPTIARWGERAGRDNPDFLNAKLFAAEFLSRIAPIRNKLAPILLEFTAFPKGAFADWTEFVHALETFFRALPSGYSFGVEIRTRDYLNPEFWAALRTMGVGPALNSWTRMPPLDEQWKMFPAFDFQFVACRPIMKPGRTRDEAVVLFEPYDRLRDIVEPVRRAIKNMCLWALEHKRPCYVFVNNHLEGCAYQTIDDISTEIHAYTRANNR